MTVNSQKAEAKVEPYVTFAFIPGRKKKKITQSEFAGVDGGGGDIGHPHRCCAIGKILNHVRDNRIPRRGKTHHVRPDVIHSLMVNSHPRPQRPLPLPFLFFPAARIYASLLRATGPIS